MAVYDGEDPALPDDDEGGSSESLYDRFDATYGQMTTLAMISSMAALKATKEELEEQLKAVNKEYDYVRIKAIPSRFEQEGIETLKVTGIGRVQLTGDMYVKPVKAKQRGFFDWLRDNGSGDLIKETVAPSTLKAAIKAWMKKGEAPPEEFVKVEPFTRASITKI